MPYDPQVQYNANPGSTAHGRQEQRQETSEYRVLDLMPKIRQLNIKSFLEQQQQGGYSSPSLQSGSGLATDSAAQPTPCWGGADPSVAVAVAVALTRSADVRPELSPYPAECFVKKKGDVTRLPVIWRGTLLRNDKKPVHMGFSILYGDVGTFMSRQGSVLNIKHKIKFTDLPQDDAIAGVFCIFLDVADTATVEHAAELALFQEHVSFFIKKERAGIIKFDDDPVLGPGMLYLVAPNTPHYQRLISAFNLPTPTATQMTFLGVLEFKAMGEAQ
eukprot:GHVH01006817.1.p1 GENE.GHVH01006817.1~~GHVH01006817.1.p1  ORF type:complete len:300 (-),score=28.91 GHVH01006817.1:1004-1825(-)